MTDVKERQARDIFMSTLSSARECTAFYVGNMAIDLLENLLEITDYFCLKLG